MSLELHSENVVAAAASSGVKPGRKKRVWTLRAGVLTALVASAIPASAAVIVQNFMRADVTRAAACLVKVAGLDVPPSAFTLNTTNTGTIGGVPLLNEQMSITGYRGDRLLLTDGVRVRNTCAYPVSVFLKAEQGTDTAATTGNWLDLSMKVYLGKQVQATVGGAALSGTDFSVAADWDATPISITPSATGTVANATTGSTAIGTTLLPAGEIQIGFQVDTGGAATSPAVATTARLNYTVNATRV
jgi:hypothetical protein